MVTESSNALKIGITGSSGLLGSVLQEGLCDKYNLFLYDVKEIKSPRNTKFIKVDLADSKKIDGIFDGLDILIYLAGNSNPQAKKEDIYRDNFKAASHVFSEAHKARVKKIIFASSNYYHDIAIHRLFKRRSSIVYSIVYRIFRGASKLITLDMPPSPSNPYAESKVFGENVGRYLSYLGISFVALRVGWVLPDDNPATILGKKRDHARAIFCSKRDLLQAFERAVEIKTTFLSAFVTSGNTYNVFDLSETEKTLHFHPQDNAENYF